MLKKVLKRQTTSALLVSLPFILDIRTVLGVRTGTIQPVTLAEKKENRELNSLLQQRITRLPTVDELAKKTSIPNFFVPSLETIPEKPTPSVKKSHSRKNNH